MTISGETALYFILAHPVAHVRTPERFNALAAQRGVDAVMVPIEIAAEDLADFLTSMRRLSNVRGAVVTMPHKSAIPGLSDVRSQRVSQCGAANVIRRTPDGRLACDMLDGLGFVEGVRRAGHELAGRSVLLAGAGGAARAIAFALADAGVRRIGVFNRTESRSRALLDALQRHEAKVEAELASRDPTGFDVVVNATSLGLSPNDPPPVDASKLTADMLVAEVIMLPERTPLIRAAEEAGARTHLGRAMLDAQLDLIADFLGASRPLPLPTGYNR